MPSYCDLADETDKTQCPFFFSLLRLALVFATVTSLSILAGSAAPALNSLAAFCKANPNLDFPNHAFFEPKRKRGALPEEVAAVGAAAWRCVDGKVYVCVGGAAGSACWKMDSSLKPSREIRETCEDNPGQNFVAIAVIGSAGRSILRPRWALGKLSGAA